MNGRRERRRERTYQALLQAASALFAERGIRATRIEDLTERVDLGKGAFYNYFDSKEDLVAELLLEAAGRLEERCRYCLEAKASLPERVQAVVEAHEAFFAENPRYLALFHQAAGLGRGPSADAAPIREAFLRNFERIGALLPLPGKETGFSREELLDAALMIGGGIAGYRSFRNATGLGPDGGTARLTLAECLARRMADRP